ncbi:MAG: hypothetical protein PHV30_07845 [Candidatus Margulisbacteria bacterium]|nr:hypothetical protein [Candidatus Margulisiibacteriota bacterium]
MLKKIININKTELPQQDAANLSAEQIRDILTDYNCDNNLKSLDGLIRLARNWGADLPEAYILKKDTINIFLKAAANTNKIDGVALHALIDVTWALIRLDENSSDIGLSELVDGLKALFGAINYLSWVIEDMTRMSDPLQEGSHAHKFLNNRLKKDWQTAITAARTVRHKAIGKLEELSLQIDEQAPVKIQKKGPIDILLAGSNNKPMYNEPFPTFILKNIHLKDDKEFATHKVPRIADLRSIFSFSSIKKYFNDESIPAPAASIDESILSKDSFANLLFPANEYPERKIVDDAELIHMISVLPYAPGKNDDLLFQLGIPVEQKSLVHIIHGEGWVTENRKLQTDGGGQIALGQPALNSDQINFFKATSAEALTARRAEIAEEVGEIISTRIVIVVKPGTTEEQANYWKMVLQFDKLSETQLEALANGIKTEKFKHSVLELVTQNRLTPSQGEILKNEIIHLDKKIRRPSQSAKNFFGDDFGPFRSGALFSMSPTKSFGGDPLGTSALHTGGSSVDTGARLGTTSQELVADPIAQPKIYVIYPVGIKNTVSIDEAAENITEYMSNIIYLRPQEKK